MSEGHSHVWTINQFFGWVGGWVDGCGDYKPSGCQSDLNHCPTDLCPESNNRWTRAGSAGDYFHALCNKQNA